MSQTVRTWVALGLAILALALVTMPVFGNNPNLSDHPVETRLIALEKLALTLNSRVEVLQDELSTANETIEDQQVEIDQQHAFIADLQAEENS